MKDSLKVIGFSLAIVLLFWLTEASLDYFIFLKGSSFKDCLLPELLFPRLIKMLIMMSLFLLFGGITIRNINRQAQRLKLFSDLINQSNDTIFISQASNGNFIYVNEKASKDLNYNEEVLFQKELSDIDTVAKNYPWENFVNKISQKEHMVYESNYVRGDGTKFPVEVNIKFVSQKNNEYLLAVCRDVTERKRAEEWYRTIIRTTKDGFFLTDQQGNILDVNEAYCRLTNFSHDELLALNIFDLFASKEKTARHFNRTAFIGSDTFESKHRCKNGQSILLEASVNYVTSGGGRFFAFLRDITERKQMEEALLAEKERLAVTLRSIGDGVIATDTKGQIVLMNNIAERITGWTQAKALGLPVSEVFYLIDRNAGIRCQNPVDQVLQVGKAVSLPAHTVLISKDGTERILAASGAPIIDHNNQIIGVVMVFQDKTMESLTEKELLKIEKLSSLGILAGGIAHDLNNVLAVILGNISLATMFSKNDDVIGKILTEAEQAGTRAQNLAKQLLTFAKGGTPIKELASIAEIIDESAKFTCTGSKARCEVHFSENLWTAEVDPGQISQVIQNLVINAIQAMPEGGVIKVHGENMVLGEENPLALRPGRYVKISVQDQGVGIWPDHLAKIFDPYFTTKQKGSGLGLATVYSIIQNHDGHITVKSTIEKGTAFHLYLPAIEKKYLPRREVEGELLQGRGKILIMDDEEMIRKNVGMMLKHLGYDTEFAEDGTKALELYGQALEAHHPFDAVIMDLTVPGGMGGRETIQKLLNLDPQAKAIVFSGYSDDPVMSHFKEYGFRGFIKKPYNIKDVSEALFNVLH